MKSAILYKSEQRRGEYWKEKFASELPQIEFRIWPDIGHPEDIKYLVAWLPPENYAEQFPNLEVVFSVGAGVDHFDLDAIPSHVKLVRMLDPELVQGITEYALMAILAAHRHLPSYIRQQQKSEWVTHPWIPSRLRRIGFMGLGAMASKIISQVQTLGFRVNGWSRTKKDIDGVSCFCGEEQLSEFIASTDILVCMLPLTSNTKYILNEVLFNELPQGASIINLGRGQHLVNQDLLVALDSGRLSYAVLDVMDEEPLAEGHAFWKHPNILLTPHIAGVTSFESGCRVLLENVKRHERNDCLNGEVEISQGY